MFRSRPLLKTLRRRVRLSSLLESRPFRLRPSSRRSLSLASLSVRKASGSSSSTFLRILKAGAALYLLSKGIEHIRKPTSQISSSANLPPPPPQSSSTAETVAATATATTLTQQEISEERQASQKYQSATKRIEDSAIVKRTAFQQFLFDVWDALCLFGRLFHLSVIFTPVAFATPLLLLPQRFHAHFYELLRWSLEQSGGLLLVFIAFVVSSLL